VFYDGKVYIGGGYVTGIGPPFRIDVYTLSSNSWSKSPIKTPYYYYALAILNNQLVTAGGLGNDNAATNKILLLTGDQLIEYTRMATRRYNTTAAGHQGTLIVVGGKGYQDKILATSELFDSTTRQWYTTDDLPIPHWGLKSVIVGSMLYLLGGYNQNSKDSFVVFTAMLDSVLNHELKWSSHQDTPWCFSAPVSVHGRLLTLGGSKKVVHTGAIHMFNEVSCSWTVIGQMPAPKCAISAVTVADNDIVVVGGYHGQQQYTNTVWVCKCELL